MDSSTKILYQYRMQLISVRRYRTLDVRNSPLKIDFLHSNLHSNTFSQCIGYLGPGHSHKFSLDEPTIVISA